MLIIKSFRRLLDPQVLRGLSEFSYSGESMNINYGSLLAGPKQIPPAWRAGRALVAGAGAAEAEEPGLWTLEGGHGPCQGMRVGWGDTASRAQTLSGMEKSQMGSPPLPLAPLLSKVYQNQREFWQLEPRAMSSESWWFGMWCVAYEGKIKAGKMIMFVIGDLVTPPQQGKCWFWKGKQTEKLNF